MATWQGNVNVGVNLGTGFFIFLTVLIILFVLWRSIGSEGLKRSVKGAFEQEYARHC